ncbi:hypothetical protein C8R44DRAFT_932932 [Mycena epipterygia]|nr:hypothetical protein C8R44DRAFT_932932 [Mycena epipterygia]
MLCFGQQKTLKVAQYPVADSINSGEVADACIYRMITCNSIESGFWLAQANQIFNHLKITSDYQDYLSVDGIYYMLDMSERKDNLPSGYLFLCPLSDLQSDIPARFQHPDCPAYWSLDPSGVERLNMEEAEYLGFPRLNLTMAAQGWYWDDSVYHGLRQFYKGKGFDPYSQDVARELGHPPYQLCCKLESPFAHAQETGTWGENIGDSLHEGVQDESDLQDTFSHSNLANLTPATYLEPGRLSSGYISR